MPVIVQNSAIKIDPFNEKILQNDSVSLQKKRKKVLESSSLNGRLDLTF